jgi:hypothetical protein
MLAFLVSVFDLCRVAKQCWDIHAGVGKSHHQVAWLLADYVVRDSEIDPWSTPARERAEIAKG